MLLAAMAFSESFTVAKWLLLAMKDSWQVQALSILKVD